MHVGFFWGGIYRFFLIGKTQSSLTLEMPLKITFK